MRRIEGRLVGVVLRTSLVVVLCGAIGAGAASAQGPPAEGDFEKVVLDDNTANPMELDVAPDGRVFYIERSGDLRIVKTDGAVVTAGTVPVYTGFENGLLGLTLDPGFATNRHVWLLYSDPAQPEQHVSRFTMDGDELDLGSEQVVLRIPHQREASNHSGGSLYFGPTGDLFIATGDDTFCCDTGFAPIDERPGRSAWDAQKSSANTNDLRGKLLRITPRADGSGYEIPEGNLFPPGTARTRPEIYAMGFRNPFRFTVDPETGWVLLADYGPDAGAPDPNRGPAGHVEQNLIRQPGNYGWPYCIANNKPYRDYDFASGASGPPFDCAAPKNESPNNTGLVDLPPVVPANIWYSYGDPPEPEFDGLPGGGAPMGGPRYHFDDAHANPRRFPAYYDDKWFIYEWGSNYVKTLDFDAGGVPRNIEAFMPSTTFKRPMDMDFGPDGALYVIEWGTGFGGNNADSGVYRIEYAKDLRPPRIAAADAQPREGLAPLTVNFSAEASDPDGGPVTYLWEFGDGATSSAQNPSHTYTENGVYTAMLTVTDEQGDTAVRNFPISVGNTAPKVTIELPAEGAIADFGEDIPYRLRIEDAEDRQVDCTRAVVQVYLGHDDHSHPMTEFTPNAQCEGIARTEPDAGHGADANTFPVLEARYTDTGAEGMEPLTGRDINVLQPRRKQAEFFTATGRLQTSSYGGGNPGVQISPTPDPGGGGATVGFIDDAEWISFDAVNLAGIESVTFRFAREFAGTWIELRRDAPDGPLVARTAALPRTPGGWGDYQDVTLPIEDPGGTHELFVVFRNPAAQHDLANLNWIQFDPPPEGNTRPQVTLELPEDGAFADGGDGVRYRVRATDAEDGAVDCGAIAIAAASGPAREVRQADPSCEGLIQIPGEPGGVLAHVEATHTDAGGLTGRDAAVLHPKRKQAEFWERTGRTEDSTAPNMPGVTNTGSGDPQGGGNATGFVDDGDWVSYGPMSLTGIDAITYRVASPGGGVRIQARRGSPGGELVSEAIVPATGGYGAYTDLTVPIADTGGSHELFFVFRGPAGSHDLVNLNWIDFEGRGASDNSAPRLTASAQPTEGLAPLEVDFTASATDPEGDAITYEWDFGVPGAPSADTPQASYTYAEPGDYTATVTATDARGASRSQSFEIEVSGDCANPKAPDPGYISLFDGTAASLENWTYVGGSGDFDLANCMITTDTGGGILWYTSRQFADFELKFDMRTNVLDANSSIMLRNPDPGGDINLGHHVQVLDSLSNPEPNKTGAIYGFKQADKLTPKPGEWREMRIRVVGRTYTVIIDGETVNEYVDDGRTSDAVRGVARDGLRPLMGHIGLENHDPVTRIDFRDIQVKDLGGPRPGRDLSDEFDGTALDTERWDSIVRADPSGYRVRDGRLEIDTRPGTLTATVNSFPPNLILQDPPQGDWAIETLVEAPVDEAYQQGGLIAYTSDDHYVKLDVVADNPPGGPRRRRIELFAEQRAQVQSTSLNLPADAGDGWRLRLTRTGDVHRGEASADGVTWTTVGQLPAPQLPAAKVGLFAVGESAQGSNTVVFEHFHALPDPGADAHDRRCAGAIGLETLGDVRVPAGATCTLNGTLVRGDVKVERGATLRAQGVRITGNVQGSRAAGATVEHSRAAGNIQLDRLTGALRVADNVVAGNVKIDGNSGGVEIAANTIDGNLQCAGNAPPPTGGDNVVHGNAQGQCAALAGARR